MTRLRYEYFQEPILDITLASNVYDIIANNKLKHVV